MHQKREVYDLFSHSFKKEKKKTNSNQSQKACILINYIKINKVIINQLTAHTHKNQKNNNRGRRANAYKNKTINTAIQY